MKKIKDTKPDTTEFNKSEPHLLVELIQYIPKSVVSRTILKKITGSIIATSLALGEIIEVRTIAFDTFIQVIDGSAEVTINDKKHQLILGNGIIIPAHASHSIKANEKFKMISTIIKSGYDVIPL